MAVFEYKALAETGKSVKGIIDADSPSAARRKLREQKLHPTRVSQSFGAGATAGEQAAAGTMGARINMTSSRDLALLTRQLAVLLEAGMPLIEALNALIDQTSKARLRKTIYDVRERVSEGKTLADALAVHPTIFSPLYVNMVGAGEAGGALEQVLMRLADILEHQARMKAKVLSTLAYPAFMLVFAVGIITFLTVVIVPRITLLFERQEQELPRITEIMIATTGFIGNYWWALIGATIALFVLWRMWVTRPEGRIAWDRFRVRVPVLGDLYLKIICGRFARILGTMLESGLTMMNALDVVITIIQNRYVESALEDIKAEVRRGRGLGQPMKESGVFPPLLIHMIELGERSGELDPMLIKVADTYDEDVQVTVDGVVSLLEPIIIIVMGLFVGLLVLSILLPILNMSSSIG